MTSNDEVAYLSCSSEIHQIVLLPKPNQAMVVVVVSKNAGTVVCLLCCQWHLLLETLL